MFKIMSQDLQTKNIKHALLIYLILSINILILIIQIIFNQQIFKFMPI